MSDIPFNVILVPPSTRTTKDIIDSYIDMFGPENTEHETCVALEMFADELSLHFADELIKLQISKNLEVLQELRQKQFEER